jgi:hypothetical protein
MTEFILAGIDQIVKGMQRLRLVTASPINETEPITVL